MTNRSQILSMMKRYGFITKRMAAIKGLSYGLGDHILHLRKKHNIGRVMLKNKRTGNRYAVYPYNGKIK